jgi:hypothetical protein
MNAIIRPSVSKWLTFDDIDFPTNARPTNATDVVALVSSIRAIGLQSQQPKPQPDRPPVTSDVDDDIPF